MSKQAHTPIPDDDTGFGTVHGIAVALGAELFVACICFAAWTLNVSAIANVARGLFQ